MLKEFVEKLLSLASPEVVRRDNLLLYRNDYLEKKRNSRDGLVVHTLNGVIDFLRNVVDDFKEPLLVHIHGPEHVNVCTGYNSENKREILLSSEYSPTSFRFDHYFDQEDFIIALRAQFEQAGHRNDLIKLISNLVKEESVQTTDDGMSQSVIAKSGIARLHEVTIENPMSLAPFRTFPEVNQPQSPFIFRLDKNKRCALFEADNGAWKLQAIDNILAYFNEHLSEEIGKKTISVIA